MPKRSQILYGGDYNPDQWPEDEWPRDVELMKELHVNAATLPVFSWAKLQPAEDRYDFAWLDRAIEGLSAAGIGVVLATPTAAQPAWMSRAYPEMLPVDSWGHRRRHGGRTQFCPNNPDYRRLSAGVAAAMAERYAGRPEILLWHVNNEYGTSCYCDTCRDAFVDWLKARYGSLEAVNAAWYTGFWGHDLLSWDDVVVPSNLSDMLPGRLWGRDGTAMQAIALDYRRFMSDSMLACYRNEAAEIRRRDPDAEITTNFWGVAPVIDLFAWGREVDVASWDNYPGPGDRPEDIAFRHDLIRGAGRGKPFLLMEQTPNQQNWMDVNALKPPGIMRLWSYQALAHGADSVMFFQVKQSLGACEKWHAAMIPHAGRLDTRIGRELVGLGDELEGLDGLVGTRTPARVAIVVDWGAWWALEYSSGPSVYARYLELVLPWYRALHRLGIAVDIIPVDASLEGYAVVMAPGLYAVAAEHARSFETFVRAGGTFLTTTLSGLVNETDLVYRGGYPGAFRDMLGLWIEEIDALEPDASRRLDLDGVAYEAGLVCDLIRTREADVVAAYGDGWYAGTPAITVNTYGDGRAWYVGTLPEESLVIDLVRRVTEEAGVAPILVPPLGVEVTRRVGEDREYLFLLNHGSVEQTVEPPGEGWHARVGAARLGPAGVAVYERSIGDHLADAVAGPHRETSAPLGE
jgi:beta-galactosidase